MSGSVTALLAGNIEHPTAYLSYLTVAWNRVYHLWDSPSEAFLAPYDKTVEELFDNNHTPEQVFGGLPETLPCRRP